LNNLLHDSIYTYIYTIAGYVICVFISVFQYNFLQILSCCFDEDLH